MQVSTFVAENKFRIYYMSNSALERVFFGGGLLDENHSKHSQASFAPAADNVGGIWELFRTVVNLVCVSAALCPPKKKIGT